MKAKLSTALVLFSGMIFLSACSNSPEGNQEIISDATTEEIPESVEKVSELQPITGLNDTIVLPDGLYCIIQVQGTGPKPVYGKKVTVHYTGYFVDGTKFDSSVDAGKPLEFRIGKGEVIKGWDRGIAILNAGSKARLIIPYELAYGVDGYPNVIPPRATLIFDIELLAVDQ